jgi:ADP-ribosylglycohydrolase
MEGVLLGAIVGDVIGSVYENENTHETNFELFNHFSRFTDDTVLTVATADAILHPIPISSRFFSDWRAKRSYARQYKAYGRRCPQAGYGEMFLEWMKSSSLTGYRSYGNGSAMRVSPIGYAFQSLSDVLKQARLSAAATHNHPDGIKGAQAVATAIFLARMGKNKAFLKEFLGWKFGYDLSKSLSEVPTQYALDSSCRGSVPPAIIAFLESEDFEDAI